MSRPTKRALASVAGLLVVIALTSTTACNYETPSKPASNWTVEDARRFNDFPLYWLGAGYEGLPLTLMSLTVDGDDVRHATFSYGEPLLVPGDSGQSWEHPLEVDIQPYCGFSPEESRYWEEYLGDEGSGTQIRGVDGYLDRYSSSASLLLWTGNSTINIHTWKTEFDAQQVVRDLIPIGEDTRATFSPLPPPVTTACPKDYVIEDPNLWGIKLSDISDIKLLVGGALLGAIGLIHLIRRRRAARQDQQK